MQFGMVRHMQDDQHENEGDDHFADERCERAPSTWYGHDVMDRRVRRPGVQQFCGSDRAGGAAEKLPGDVEDSVPPGNLAEPEKSQSCRRIDMRARLLAPWGVDDGNCRAAHRQPHQKTAHCGISDRLMDGGSGVFEQGGEAERRDHE